MFTKYTKKATLAQKILITIACVWLVDYFLGMGLFNNLKNSIFSMNTERFEGNKNSNSSKLECVMYYTEWCPHCKTAKPEWAKLTDEYHGKNVGGTQIIITKIDCDENPDAAKKEGVDGFPTFKFKLNGNDIAYNSERKYDAFKQFIDNIVYQDRS